MRHVETAPERDRRASGFAEIVSEGHAETVQPLHISVKAICAVTAHASTEAACHAQRMTKAHPIRPHLQAWRQRMGKTLVWLANEIGTSHSTVQRQEKGKLGVDDATFAAIARAYGISVAELSADPADSEKARELARLMDMLKQLDARSVRTLADLSEQLGGKKS